jgi:Fe-S-cluster containining protein
MSTANIQGAFDSFLSALGDPEGGDAFYGMQTAEAIVRHPEGVGPLAALDRHAFANAHRELNLQGRDALPQFGVGRTKLLQAPAETDGGTEVVAWFEVIETREQRALVVALGLQSVEGAWRIGWCTLAARVEAWTYSEGLLQSIADYPWMRTTEPARARALLDASYFRRHWRADVKFSTLKDARFSCQMSTDCCRHDFEITLPPDAQLVIDAMPWESVRPELRGTRLPVRPDGKLQLKAINETCRFLGAQHQCLIHQRLGRQPFGPCSVFPFAFAQTPEGVAVSMSPICGASRRGMGLALAAREEDLRERLVQAEPRRTETFHLAPGVEITWEQFRDTENVLCEVLAAQELPMRRRLYVGTRLLNALRNGEPVDMNRWLGEPAVEISQELREVIRAMLARVLGWDRATLRALPQALPADLGALEMLDQPVITRILQNTLFCKTYSYSYDLTTAYNFLIVLYLLALIMQAASRGSLSDAMWRELGSLGVHGLLKAMLHDGVPDGFRGVFGTAEFGQWLLVS